MTMQQSLSGCVKALAELQLLINSKRWESIPKCEEMLNSAFLQLRQEMVGDIADVNDQQNVKLLEQQVRRIQREMKMEMGEMAEKLGWLDMEQKRTSTTLRHLGSES